MTLDCGIMILTDKDEPSSACARMNYFVPPENAKGIKMGPG